ncbi:MAG TPA: zinc-binding dehydrogenase [Ilumatobacteraceae bacterium]
MSNDLPDTMRQLRSLVTEDGQLQLSLVTVPMPQPQPHEVLVRVEAAPINPSDLGLLLATADLATAAATGSPDDPVVTAQIPPQTMRGLAARVGRSMAVGNEGAGVVVAAGTSDEAQALVGRTVSIIGGETYAEYRCAPAMMCMALPEGTDPALGASWFVNPMTALGMVETMRMEGHSALVHTAAASNLGQMLQRVCLADGVPLVNIVRRDEHVELLRGIGAEHVCNSSAPSFTDDLTRALVTTGATICFDAIGGGRQAGQILACMEAAINANATEFSRYGSNVHKQVYIYGGLDRGPTEFNRNFGMAWGIGGWLLSPFLQKIGPAGMERLRNRVATELATTFASHYTDEVTLAGALDLAALTTYARQATGQKFLIRPSRS